MGAAIVHLTRLATSLPSILPFAADEIRTQLKTGTIEVHDEIIPTDEDEDISLRKRDKSIMEIIITIGDGDDVGARAQAKNIPKGHNKQRKGHTKTNASDDKKAAKHQQLILQEGEQNDGQMEY